MGAFENQIRENETFESLMDLYRESLRENRQLLKALKDLVEDVTDPDHEAGDWSQQVVVKRAQAVVASTKRGA